MKKDIPFHKVEDLAIAIVPRVRPDNSVEELWDCHILNFKDDPIQDVLINSKGYGQIDGEYRKTTILRHFFLEIGPQRAAMVEPMPENLFELTNEFWVSFKYNGYMYDKKYVFVQGSISTQHLTAVPFLEQEGVMIK